MLRARASEQAEGAQLKTQSWNGHQGQAGWTASGPTGSPGLSWPLPLDMLGTGARPEPGLDTEQPQAPADAGAAQGDSSLYCPAHAGGWLRAPRAVTGSQSHHAAWTGPGFIGREAEGLGPG